MEWDGTFADAEDLILQAARREAGLEDFGEPSFLEGLRRLLTSLDEEFVRGPSERAACAGTIVQALVSRLYAQEGWNRRPEVLAQRLERPVFIVGAPRTGTTALHRLLSADPAWQGLEKWLIATPMVRPPRSLWESLPQYRRAAAGVEAAVAAKPELRSIHHISADEPDECLRVTGQTMVSNMFGSIMAVSSYDAWLRKQDQRPVYRRLADNMRLIGADDDRRWLLKNPSHLLSLEALLETFEDALVIHTHRDPLVSMPSFWSLTSRHQRAFDGAHWRARRNVERELPLWTDALNRSVALQQRHADRILDVQECDIVSRPLELMADIHAFVGQPFTAEARAAAQAWIADNPKGKHGDHRYALADFDTNEAEVAAATRPYRLRHGFADGA